MRRIAVTFCLALLAVAALRALPLLTAEQIARNVQDRNTGKDSRADLRMRLFDPPPAIAP